MKLGLRKQILLLVVILLALSKPSAVISSSVSLPQFVGACSYGGGPANYRIVSDPLEGVIYFHPSIKRSGKVTVSADEFRFEFRGEYGENKAVFRRKSGVLTIYARDEFQRRTSGDPSYKCDPLPITEHKDTLKRLKGEMDEIDQKREAARQRYNSTPNRF